MSLQFSFILLLGAGSPSDAYFAAQTIPAFISVILVGALTNNLTPMVAGLDDIRGPALVRTAMLQCLLVALALFGTLAVTAQWWLPLLFAEIARNNGQLAIDLARIFCASSAVQVLSAIGTAGQYARKKFALVEATQLVTTLLALAFVAPVINAAGIIGFAWLLLARAGIALGIINFHFIMAKRLPVSELMKALWIKTTQVSSGSVVFKLGPVIDRMLGSLAPSGILTSLGIGQQLLGSALSVTERAMARPLLVAAGARSESEARQEILSIYYGQLRIMLIAVAVGFSIVVPITFIAMQGGRMFGMQYLPASLHLDLIFLLALTLVPAAAGQLSASLMYALGDIRSLNRLALLSFFISTALKILGFLYMGVYAIIAGIFLYQALNWLFLHVVAVRTLRRPYSSM